MKLYTEEQVRQAYNLGFVDGYDVEEKCENSAISLLTPIELPSDDEIEEDMKGQSGEYACGWEDAFKWMKEQILNQNKG